MKNICEEAVVANIELLSRHISERVEENYERRQTGQKMPRSKFEPGTSRI